MMLSIARLACAALVAAAVCSCRPPASYAPLPDSDPATVDASSAVPQDPAVLRAATFNTHLFFDTICDSGRCAAGDFEQVATPQTFAQRADAAAKAIRSFGADVVSLQEIETQTSLDAIARPLFDLYPTVVMGETGLPGSIDVAVLSTGALLEVRRHRDQPLMRADGTTTSFTRELLEVHLELKGSHVVMFAAHFRSKASDDPGRRLAEAQAARDLVLATAKEFPAAVVLLGGDLNDTPASPPLDALEGSAELLRVAKDRPPESVATYLWQGKAEAIDHLFLALTSGGAYVPASAAAVRDPSGSSGLAGSDHAALRADFRVR